ncbi:MAG: hypothetical protein K2Y21_07910 [Phycisphaerales bacterium]|nr:hypothetical protein [Phycisphaerales bacterium]
MNWLLNNPQIFVFFAIAAFSVLQWILKTVASQQAARQRRLQIEQQELEALRTGRQAAPPMGVPAEFSREAELAELRRRAQARAEQSSREERVDPGMPSPTPTQQPNPLEILLGLPPGSTTGGTIPPRGGKSRDIAAERRKRREARAGTSRPTPTSNPNRSDNVRSDTQRRDNQSSQDKFSDETRAERVRTQNQERLRVDKIRREQDRRDTASAAAAQQQRIAAAHAATEVASPTPQTLSNAPRRTSPIKLKSLPNSRASWRQALIVNEILNKPLALRTDADRGIL